MLEQSTSPPASIKALMHGFIHDRFLTKSEKLATDDPAYLKLREQFEPQTWLADAARRVGQLQVVTHSLKAVHPDAKGTNLYVEPQQLDQQNLVGSHCLPADFDGDVVGNAAALDVYKFLKLQWNERTLLELALEHDAALLEALSDDIVQAREWLEAFANIVEPKGTPSSHARGKQVFWLVGEDPTVDTDYRLLAPLYATALTHPFHARLSDARFGDNAKAGRKARKDNLVFEGGYADYLNLAVQKLGGTKPQNISQLNSERGGQNYLLASLPPNWQSRSVYAPMTESLRSFQRRPEVRRIVNDLKRFLETDPAKNMQTRDLRDDLTAMLTDELMLFTFDIHSLTPGWTKDERCRLAPDEQFWLDPGRSELDAGFAAERRQTDWSEKISARAASWLNRELERNSRISFGDAEHQHWKGRFDGVLESFRRQLDDMQDAIRHDDDEGEAA